MNVDPTRRLLPLRLAMVALLALAGAGTTLWAVTAADGQPQHHAYVPALAADSAPSSTPTASQDTTTPTPSSTAPTGSATPGSTISPTAALTPSPTATATATLPQYLAVTLAQGEQSVTIAAELALTPSQWRRGLMGRTSLADDQGMLFVFPSEQTTGFWMAGTPIPLDIAYINPAGAVFDIKHGEPHDLTSLVPSGPYLYVLEVRGGWFEDMGMGVGAQIEGLEGLP